VKRNLDAIRIFTEAGKSLHLDAFVIEIRGKENTQTCKLII
jgi:hypothetical protein